MIDTKRIHELASKCSFKPEFYMYSENCDTGKVDGIYFCDKVSEQGYMFEYGWDSVNSCISLDGYHPLPKPQIDSNTLRTILYHVPKSEITPEFLSQLDIDMTSRGVNYLNRCFIGDHMGDLEKALSDKFVKLVQGDKLPDEIVGLMDNDTTVKAMASLYQWLCTNVGFCYLTEAFKEGGYKLKLEKIDK